MNAIERRALYNLLRMNWLNEPTLSVEPWQVEDYRSLPLQTLFDRLKQFKIHLDRMSFVAYADECDSPENLVDHLVGDRNLSTTQEDEAYLLIFELWRRLMSEKPSLSILCNELDYQIHLYDQQQVENPLALQNALTHFVQALDENSDQGIPPQDILKLISNYCANDIETFLYDFISEQIDEGNEVYARELLDDFDAYLGNNKWFKLLRIRLCEQMHNKTAQKIAGEIIEEHLHDHDLDYNLEFLSILVEMGDQAIFHLILKHTLPLIKREEEFRDLLSIAMDHCHHFNQEQQEATIKTIFEKHSAASFDQAIDAKNPDIATLTQLFNLKDLKN
jgi:hypothetical protein